MCGIAGIILKKPAEFRLSDKIARMSTVMSHRGPDGEGFMMASATQTLPYSGSIPFNYKRSDLPYIPKQHINTGSVDTFIAFAHRRLAIIDLSESGHQPMCNADQTLWITFNGEIYNYIELRDELKKMGHTFISESDTEVVLHAYRQWGTTCVERFNGMWAFCIYDKQSGICFASRDRLGVKPFYYINNDGVFAFASEQKAFTKSGLISANWDQKALHNYLINDLLESEPNNFFSGVQELWPGNNLVYSIATKEFQITPYFHLKDVINLENDHLSEKELVDKISSTLERAIQLRLRSDVEVGTCLSGGIDSSVLAVTMAAFSQNPVYCFTSVFRNQPFNEEVFADVVAGKIKGHHVKTEPSLDGFLKEADDLIYSQDVPIWSTSTYAQHKVMELAKQNKIKVVLDGQGADELFGGYHHHFIARWNNLIQHGHYVSAIGDIAATGKSIPAPFMFYFKEKIKQQYHPQLKHLGHFFKKEFISVFAIQNPSSGYNDLNTQLLNDIYERRLKIFLKCEDRCGMWHSVESRTPFSDDIDLMKLLFSFNANKKIKQGVSKYLLREAMKNKLPEQIYSRYDKKGFETPMQDWITKMRPQLLSEVQAADFDFVNALALEKANPHSVFQNKLLFKLFVLARWKKLFN